MPPLLSTRPPTLRASPASVPPGTSSTSEPSSLGPSIFDNTSGGSGTSNATNPTPPLTPLNSSEAKPQPDVSEEQPLLEEDPDESLRHDAFDHPSILSIIPPLFASTYDRQPVTVLNALVREKKGELSRDDREVLDGLDAVPDLRKWRETYHRSRAKKEGVVLPAGESVSDLFMQRPTLLQTGHIEESGFDLNNLWGEGAQWDIAWSSPRLNAHTAPANASSELDLGFLDILAKPPVGCEGRHTVNVNWEQGQPDSPLGTSCQGDPPPSPHLVPLEHDGTLSPLQLSSPALITTPTNFYTAQASWYGHAYESPIMAKEFDFASMSNFRRRRAASDAYRTSLFTPSPIQKTCAKSSSPSAFAVDGDLSFSLKLDEAATANMINTIEDALVSSSSSFFNLAARTFAPPDDPPMLQAPETRASDDLTDLGSQGNLSRRWLCPDPQGLGATTRMPVGTQSDASSSPIKERSSRALWQVCPHCQAFSDEITVLTQPLCYPAIFRRSDPIERLPLLA
ncbi:hypothetical protein BKA70DRAFT_231328 [Coprinopsis sp. MPI-PUGE-AT-0042]|nr:hypothetical protein BKA70DRAFT_231328 [Coprinopsis sp. MPI-PUGE-AT-0042]